MTLEDAKKVTQLLNAIVAEAGQIPLQDETQLHGTARVLKHHVSQLRQVLDVGVLVEQDRTTARLLSKLQTLIPEGSQAAVALKLGRAELRQRGIALPDEEQRPARRMA